ncbi:hypothetical protein BDZ85DRAFT_259129 [Elsinoe ampelina]|uniref:Uncharacterized protein n=1 Tax=Elsinoe ampelina TaxID=302913 RepID=A0A6A6GGH9_9PEZI|nr:hypothetical protein BDZ85DRAFT_259129 [Elsinoe ampelina]
MYLFDLYHSNRDMRVFFRFAASCVFLFFAAVRVTKDSSSSTVYPSPSYTQA